MKHCSFCLLWLLLLSGCSSVTYLAIDTYRPAEITFPTSVSRVLVANNAVAQPADAGFDYYLYGMLQDTARAVADSALYSATVGLSIGLAQEEYFDDVFLIHLPIRDDGEYLVEKPLTKDQIEELCDVADTDAVISLDRLLFNTRKVVKKEADGGVSGEILVVAGGTARAYLRDRENPLTTIHFSDSIKFVEEAINYETIDWLLPSPHDALTIAGDYLGKALVTKFSPYWEQVDRFYFTGMNARWKEATAYAKNNNWEEAARRWQSLYEQAEGWKTRARLAHNLALMHEMSNRLEEALAKAQEAKELFEKHRPAENSERKAIEHYVEALGKRLLEDKKLNIQLGS
ncbi:tetratricopeptide repeat protein [Parabacteroides sp. OttesenSCG-928-N08]|nr:tetratricopeptide repeat protein [Parabacteroides sp. OttesenSCG-928-N08]